MSFNKPYLLYFDKIGMPEEGYITTTQYAEKLPFLIKRVFWTYKTPVDVVRGRHAHKQTEQVLIAVNGTIRIEVDAGTGDKIKFILEAPDTGLYLPPMYWTRIFFSEGAILLSLASSDYAEDEYIRDYNAFLKEVRNQQK